MTKDTLTDSQADEWLDDLLDKFDPFDNSHNDFMRRKSQIKAAIQSKLAEAEQANLDEIRKWVEWNKHDMGEMGEFIRTKYVFNKLDELQYRQALNERSE